MPVAVLAAGLVAIALAFAAISATLLVRQLVVNPIRGAAVAVAEVAVVGGVISWALTQLANIIEIGLSEFQYLAQVGQQQAADWWNTLIYGTVNALYRDLWNALIWYQANFAGFSFILATYAGMRDLVYNHVFPSVSALSVDLAGLHAWINSYELPLIRGIGDDLAGLHGWIDSYELPLIRGIGNDLAGLHDWINQNLVTRNELANAEAKTLAQVGAVVVPLEQAITDIQNSPCMKACGPLGDLGGLIQGLEDAGLAAIMLALIAQATSDPAQLVVDIDSDISPLIKSTAHSFQLGIPD